MTSRTRLAQTNFSFVISNSGPDFINFAVASIRYLVPGPIFPAISFVPKVCNTAITPANTALSIADVTGCGDGGQGSENGDNDQYFNNREPFLSDILQ